MTRRQRPPTPKTLLNMPDAVRQSAWDMPHHRHWRARLLRFGDWLLEILLFLYKWACWPVTMVLLLQAGSALFSEKTPPPGDAVYASLFYLFGFVLAWLSQWVKVVLRTPRSDHEYPLVSNLQDWWDQVWVLAQHAWFCMLLLWSWVAFLPKADVLQLVIGATVQTIAAVWLVSLHVRKTRWGRRVPPDADVAERSRRYLAGLEASANPAHDDYPLDLEAQAPEGGFDSIHGMAKTKERIWNAALEIEQGRQAGGETPRNGILLHGAPGNGKTVFASALAGEMGIPLVTITYGTVAGKWKGESSRKLAKCFAFARQNAPCVLFLDEIDSMIRQRGPTTHDEDIKTTNVLLTEIVALRQHPVILMAATNFLESLDAAAIREGRFDYKVEVPPPDFPARLGILQSAAQKHIPRSVDETALESVAKRWDGYSVSRLVAVVKAVADQSGPRNQAVSFDDWQAALRTVQGSKGRDAGPGKRLQELILEQDVAGSLQLLAGRMKNIEASEALGATLPKGVLFYGPPGTGKTAAARALAKESGWAFLPVAGPELLHDAEALPKLMQQAADLRPTLVFIDEADDVLRNRSMNPRPEVVNRLLTLMDSVEQRMQDVVIVAATNHPEQIDEALLRAGRFTEKILFAPPSVHSIAVATGRWLASKNLNMPVAEVEALARRLEGTSIATVEGVLQHALNSAVHRALQEKAAVQIMPSDLDSAIRVVAP